MYSKMDGTLIYIHPKKETIDDYEIILDRLSDYEKEKKEYFCVYEIETDKDLDEIADLTEYMTEMLYKLK